MKNISFLVLFCAGTSFLGGCNQKQASQCNECTQADSTIMLFTGSYSPADSEGIQLYEFNLADGSAKKIAGVTGVSNPSYIVPSADGSRIYSVGEDAGESSTINLIRFNKADSTLTLEKTDTTGGGAPCYINLSPDERFVLTANYLGGNVTIYALDETGRPAGEPQILTFADGKPTTKSEGKPRLHSVTFAPAENPDSMLLLCADLGTDRVHVFPLETANSSTLVDPAKETVIEIVDNSGPRHIVYSANGQYAYMINEIGGTVTVMKRNGSTFNPVQYIASENVEAHGSGDIRMSPDGKFLYSSNRLKDDGIAIFSIDAENGLLTRVGYQTTGPHPRNFAITPDGNWLLVACRDSNEIEIYRRDPATGLLTRNESTISTPKPVCLRFFPEK